MDSSLTNSNEHDDSENQNLGNTTTEKPEENINNINCQLLDQNEENKDSQSISNDKTMQNLYHSTKPNEIKNPSIQQTVLLELSDDENDEDAINQENILNVIPHKQIIDQNNNDNNGEINQINAVDKFLSSNLNTGRTFTEDLKTNDDTINLSIDNSHQIIEPDYNAETQTNDEGQTFNMKAVPELLSSNNYLNIPIEPVTPSNITTEENSPKSRPFSPDTSNSPLSPMRPFSPENDENQFKTLSIDGNREDGQITIESEQKAISGRTLIRPSIMRYNPLFETKHNDENVYTGLQNQGATCYMNSMLQALYHLPIFRRFIYQMDYSEAASDEQNIPLNLQRLFAMMQLRISPSVSTKELTNSFGWTDQDTYTQHDVQEFCRVILDNLETKMNKQENLKDAIASLFRGTTRSEIRLKTNDFEKENAESFYDLSMIVKDTNSLEDSFRKYVEPEIISDYDTEKNGKQDIIKSVEFVKFPPVLHLHLRRFEYDPQAHDMKKINSRFEFGESIDLSQFMPKESVDQDDCYIYDLFGVLVHQGGSYSGHYYAYLRPTAEETWFLFNDSIVKPVNKEEAIEDNFGGQYMNSIYSSEKRYSAYMLVYIKRSCIEKFYEKVSDSEIPKSAFDYVQEKKIKMEQEIEEKRRRENTVNLKIFSDENLRINALRNKVSSEFPMNSLKTIQIMKDDHTSVLYDKVRELFNYKKFVLYKADPTQPFMKINQNSMDIFADYYCKQVYIYTNFKENRTKGNHHQNFNNEEMNEFEEEEEEEKSEEEEEEEEEESFGYYGGSSKILVFFFIYIQNEEDYPIRFWKSELINQNWNMSRVIKRFCHQLKTSHIEVYQMISINNFAKIKVDYGFDKFYDGSTFVLEIDNSFSPRLKNRDNKYIKLLEEKEEEDKPMNYFSFYPPQSFIHFLNYSQRQVNLHILYSKINIYIRIPTLLTNKKFVKFVKRRFGISKMSNVFFYKDKKKYPLEIVSNDSLLNESISSDCFLYAYSFSLELSYDLFSKNMRLLYYCGDGYMQFRQQKTAFMSPDATVQSLIDYKTYERNERYYFRVVTLYNSKLKEENPNTPLKNLRGTIRIEKIPTNEDDDGILIHLSIEKEAAVALRIFKNYRIKNVICSKDQINCLFMIFKNELFVDTLKRIVEIFKCDENAVGRCKFFLINNSLFAERKKHKLVEEDSISEIVDDDAENYKLLVEYVDDDDDDDNDNSNDSDEENNDSNNNSFNYGYSLDFSSKPHDSIRIQN